MGTLARDTYSPTHTIPAPRVHPTRRSEHGPVVATRGSPLVRVVDVVGEIDLLTAPALADHLTATLTDDTPLIVVVDLQQVTFLAAAGLSVLVAADWQAQQQHTVLRIVATTYPVCRVLHVTGLDHTLAIYPELDLALAV